MTKSVGVHEAKTHLSRLLEQVRAGEEVARLVPARGAIARSFGIDAGRFAVPMTSTRRCRTTFSPASSGEDPSRLR